jgi:serine/threonine-protein kinase
MPLCHSCHKDHPAGVASCPHCGVAAKVTTGVGAPKKTQHIGSTPPVRAATPVSGVPVTGAATAAAVAVAPQFVPGGDLQPGTVVGEYRVEGKLGEGGMGAVYSAVHPLIGKKAAIKVLSAALCTDHAQVERFVQEARSVNQIGHPNIVDIFAFGSLPDGRSYFVMEWLQGQSLADRVQRGGLTLAEAIEILDQSADALEAAHEKKIVHRDLKPDNVFLVAVRGNRQLVKLLDFGIAKLASADGGMQKTATGMMMGTPGYISPEQARGKSDVDHRTDVYAFGCMAYEMLCGRLPFIAESAMDVVLKHLTEMPVPPRQHWPDIPPQLNDLLLRMLEKDPGKRPSLTDFRTVMNEVRGIVMQTMGAAGSTGFRSQFGARPVTPGTAQKFVTPVPGSMGQVATQPPIAAEPVVARKSRLPLILGAAALVIGGVGAAIAMSGGKESQAKVPPMPPPVVEKAPEKVVEKEPEPEIEMPVETIAARGKLEIKVDAPDAVIELDGRKVASSTNHVTLDVDVGDHKLLVSAPGMKPSERAVTIVEGAAATVDVKLEPEKVVAAGKKPAGEKKPKADGEKKPAGDGEKKGGGDKDAPIDPFAQ